MFNVGSTMYVVGWGGAALVSSLYVGNNIIVATSVTTVVIVWGQMCGGECKGQSEGHHTVD